MGYNVFGHTVGLKPSELKNLERFYRRRVPPASIISHELARELAKVSADLNRQVGLLINRKGEIDYVVVGTFNRIELPELRGYRDHIARLKGLRFIHTHLLTSKITHSELDQDDLIDLALLRLDLVGALEVHPNGEPGKIHIAHIIPDPEFFAGGSLSDKENQFFYFLRPCYVWELKENFLELIKNLEDELERVKPLKEVEEQKDRAILIFLREPNDPYLEERIFELRELARTAGVTVVGEIVQKKPSPDPRYVIGKGKLLEVMVLALRNRANLLIFDRELTPSQVRAITESTDLRVIDRTQLILDIFAQRAKSKEGKIQVEIAQLKYTLPRLRAKDDAFSRLTGGIGGRGPGETKLEIDKRRIKDRIAKLERELEKISQERDIKRKRRKKLAFKTVALIGYTNAGKTTLFNTLAKSQYLAEDKLFATLDPVTKAIRTPNNQVFLITDTVGFIRNLPEDLKKAFRATLEELYSADLLLHIVDISNPDFESQIETVNQILEEMELLHYPLLMVFNKIDLLPPSEFQLIKALSHRYKAIPVSAKRGDNLDLLLTKIEEILFKTPLEYLTDKVLEPVSLEEENPSKDPLTHKLDV
ncbi:MULTISPECIES: GTPase HflX [Thermodesulfobacterium]|jgi:GTP-binding protein HflX|uniref:GTPase HflX n=3 Tax=Thermodesulfobacterium commune TaxID=1741 RepID=A0A075WRJ8_9BACT|nr:MULTISPECIES: GTPase HflX [Thermodesulfobacterium]AIH03939.1 GTP-binding protein HflX [Thermodesulfobacterium commune DSM 2178]MBZ4681817.1 GTP-binding protein HflX [Thermodesulfobacterium sp.]MDN5379981.1 GTPase [Thermodesulfobacterium sp.]